MKENLLKKPYPFLYEGNVNRIKVAGFVFLFVFLFLFIFKPFHIEEIKEFSPLGGSFIFGITSAAVCFVGVSLLVKLYPHYANDQSWNIGRETIFMLAILFSVSVANFIIGSTICIIPGEDLTTLQLAGLSITRTYSVGFFPVMIITFVNYTVLLKRNLAKVEKHQFAINDNEPDVIVEAHKNILITSSTNNNDIEINLDELLYVMSDGNYVEFHLLKDEKEVREIRRNTMNNISKQLKSYPFIFKTHRAFMVNLGKIKESKGNAQGYQLRLEGSNTWIPVSRGNLAAFDKIVNANNVLLEQYSL